MAAEMESVTVGTRDGRVVLYNPLTRTALSLSWRAADEVAHAMMWRARGVREADAEVVCRLRVWREAGIVFLQREETGQLLFMAPCAAAHRIGEALLAQARHLDTLEHAERIAWEQGLLYRAGMGLPLAPTPELAAEGMRQAHWDTTLRRALPGGVRSTEIVGRPLIDGGKGSI